MGFVENYGLRDENGNVVSVGILAPAVTPWISTLAPETGGNNPSVRLFKYETESGKVSTALTRNSAMLVQKHNNDHATLDHFFGFGKCS